MLQLKKMNTTNTTFIDYISFFLSKKTKKKVHYNYKYIIIHIFIGDQDSHRVEHAHQGSEAEADGKHGFHADLENVKCITTISCLRYKLQ